ncbi:MAG: M3 family metallopeptidase [Myxococcales bacterium]|nr:M3 family metallopeptidase [Myxococcales bacterium]
MQRLFVIGAVTAALQLACGSCPKKDATSPVAQEHPEAEAPAVPKAPTPHEAAQADVARLRALAEQNPLLAPWTGPYAGVPPWDRAKVAEVPAAFELGMALQLAEIDAIAQDPAPATFANTLVPLEDSGRHQSRIELIFDVMTSNLSSPEVQAVERAWAPKLAELNDKIVFNPRLFARIEAVYGARQSAGLSAEQQRLVERTYDQFVRIGAKLSAEQKQKLGQFNQELATAFTDFSSKMLADEQTWITLDRPADLAGLPDSLRAAYKAAAEERKLPGKWVVANTRSSVDPFLAASTRRDLREKVWRAFKGRGDNGDANDTAATISRIVKLRAERAALLGYKSHAHWRMTDTMAVEPQKAMDLMMRVWPAAVARVRQEVADMQAIAKKEKPGLVIEPWDYLYYAEKVRKAKYALDQAQIKPYFELNNMIAASFFMAEQLYDLAFKEITGTVPVFHPDVRVWEVTRKSTGAHVGLFYGDYFARAGKRSGAWAAGYRGRETFTGKVVTPITSNNNNFVRGAPGEPVLISLDDADTLFHEFGHALHGLLSEINYPGLGRTPRDFVEYPSQVHEMWVLTRPVLDRFAKHYKTGAPMPQSLVDKIDASSKFNQGYGTVEYLSSAILDMEMHVRPDGVIDPKTFERDSLARLGMPKEMAMRHRLPHFGHLFSSDAYSAGYYSYLWSEVMDSDTREAFLETGDVFHKATAEKLRKHILAPGNTTDRAEAYRQFRGRDPDIKALLKKRGFPTQ